MRNAAWLKTLVVTGAALSALGCPSSSSSVSIDEFPTTFGNAYCARVFGCCDTAEQAMLMGILGNSEAECRMRAPALYGTLSARVSAGSLTYDANLAGACLARVRDASCGGGLGEGFAAECDAVFVGRVAAGGTCSDSQDCVDGHYCGGSGGSRTCRAIVALGGTCSLAEFGACVDGAYCDTSTSTCTALRANGAACTSSEQCTSGRCDGALCVAPAPVCDGR